MSKLEKLKEKARSLEGKDPKGAIEAWLEILKGQEKDGEPNPDLAIFNRIGDLYLKLREPAQAADYYDQAVDKYAELGFHNNAIAMCNKVLRNAPGRDRKSTRLNSSHLVISYAVFCLKKKKKTQKHNPASRSNRRSPCTTSQRWSAREPS